MKLKTIGRLYYWFDYAWARDHEKRIEFDDAGPDLSEVDDVDRSWVDGAWISA